MKFTKLTLALMVAAGMSFAATFSGNLVDASCAQQDAAKAASCQPTAATSSFALLTADGKVYTLDTETNQDAAEAAKEDMNKLRGVTITGELAGSMIDAESVNWGGSAR